MQAVVLAGGNSSRFYPFNKEHKSFVKVLGKSIIEHTLISIKKSGIKDAVVVIKTEEAKRYVEKINPGLKLKFVLQKESLGMGDALLLSSKYLEEDFFLLHAHRVDFEVLKKELERIKKEKTDIVLSSRKVIETTDYQKMGILRIKKGLVVEVVEKPKKNPPSEFGIVGVYLLNRNFIDVLKNTSKEHYNFEKAISDYAKKYCVRFEVVKNNMSFKYPWEILSLKNYLLRNIRTDISKKAKISKSAEILGEVVIEEGVQIMENAVIKGPCFIGKNCFVGNNSVLRDGVDLEEGTVVGANMEVKNTLIMDYSKTHSGFLGDSIIGKNCRIGAGFCSANVRLNRDSIKVKLGEEKIDTRAKSMGVIVGDGARIGMQSSSMPGIIIGRNVVVGPKTTVMNNIEDNTKYYTKFQEVIIKKN